MSPLQLTLAERAERARRIGFTFGKIYLGIKALQLVQVRIGRRAMRPRWSRFNHKSAVSIHRTAIDLRGLILKGCQYLGSRADILPPEYVEVLAELQDRVPAKPFPVISEIVESELGGPIREHFRSFEEAPVAAASLAQVHRATLLSGEGVAVKVQYPEIPVLVQSDLGNLRALFRAVGLIERDFDLMPLIEELGTELPRELDFEIEAASLERIGATFEGREDVSTPRVYPELSTKRVLVMEYIEGIKISDRDALRRAGVDANELMRSLIEAYCEQIFIHGDFHADPHPGNLLVQPGKAASDRPRIVFLDFGLTKTLPDSFRAGIVKFAAGLLQGQAEVMADALIDLGFETRDGESESLIEIARVLVTLGTRLRHQSFVDPALARTAGEEIQRLVRENPIVRIPTHLVLLGRVVGLLSGLGRSLEARVDMLKLILPYAMRAAAMPPATAQADSKRSKSS